MSTCLFLCPCLSVSVYITNPVIIRLQIFRVLQHLHDTREKNDEEDEVIKVTQVDDPVTESSQSVEKELLLGGNFMVKFTK